MPWNIVIEGMKVNFNFKRRWLDECVVDNHPQYAVKFSKMGYRKDGNITNIPLYLVGKTKELLEGERDLEWI